MLSDARAATTHMLQLTFSVACRALVVHLQMLRLLLLLLCGLAARALGMTFTPSPDEAGHMRSNWDNWGMIHNVRHSCLLLC
jgi:hypothetical protein